MYTLKTKATDQSVIDFLERVEVEKRKTDGYQLLDLFERVTKKPAKMWGSSIIGFGSCHYVYASGHEGDMPLVGFSPRKNALSLYFTTSEATRAELLSQLGKNKAGVGCVYVKKLEDIDLNVLETFILETMKFLEETYPT